LCLCAGRNTQRSKAIWITHQWRWILKAWLQAKGRKPGRSGHLSQSSISRFLFRFNAREIADLMTLYAREGFAKEWEDYVAKVKATQAKRRNRQDRKGKQRTRGMQRFTYKAAKKKRPQYCIDGKSRRGCISTLTGRTEIDLTIYCPETSQILGHKTLPDKVGEQSAAPILIRSAMRGLPSGIFTGDAGITSPAVVEAIRQLGHSYILAIKGNAGRTYDDVVLFDWDRVEDKDLFFNEGHGRREIRTIQAVSIEEFESDEFDKYQDAAVVFKVTNQTLDIKTDKFTSDTRFFIGDEAVERLTHHEAITYIRDHWQQESYHWQKDVVLGEDRCPTKNANGSQILGLVRAAVIKTGKAAYGSVKRFTDNFSSNPKEIYEKRL
jgi:hypothetical protein